MDQATEELLMQKNWAIMDIEYITTSSTHRCVRKLYILPKNGKCELDVEFFPCKQYKELENRYQRTFRFCRSHIHKLTYNPKQYSPLCRTALEKINDFIVYNDIDLILYKGGTIEKDICGELDILSKNIECIEDLVKARLHDPKFEVNFYYDQIRNIISKIK